MQWSTALTEVREAVDATRQAAATSAGEARVEIEARLDKAGALIANMIDALRNDTDDIEDPAT